MILVRQGACAVICAFGLLAFAPTRSLASDTAFAYQGQLRQHGVPANGLFDFHFRLLEANGVTQITRTCVFDIEVVNGLFTTEVDFGTATLSDTGRFIAVSVRPSLPFDINDCPNTIIFGENAFVPLDPPQPLRATPYALHARHVAPGNTLDGPNGNPADAVFVDAQGNVGLNTTNPSADLHIRGKTPLGRLTLTPGTADSSTEILLAENTSATLGAKMRFDGVSNQWQVLGLARDDQQNPIEHGPHMVVNRDNGFLGIGTTSPNARLHINAPPETDPIRIQFNGSTRFRMHSNGRVAIGGNFTPLAPLHVSGGVHVSGTTRDFSVPSEEAMQFGHWNGSSFTERMRFNPDGFVGIGTNSPQARLHVGGTPGTDGIMFPDGSVQTKAVNVMRLSVVIDVPLTNAGQKRYILVPFPGAKLGMLAIANRVDFRNQSNQSLMVIGNVFIERPNEVVIMLDNRGPANENPAPQTFEIAVMP